MKNANKYTSDRINDHTINCDICGTVCWYSETRTLEEDTGQGGAIVCKRHRDPVDYGLVPYKIPAEQSVQETRILSNFNDNSGITGDTPFDTGANDPLSSN